MNTNCFTRPNKPLICKLPNFDIKAPVIDIKAVKLLTVDSSTECHTTPDSVADLMVSYLNYEKATVNKSGSSILEPSAGTGQLVNALLKADIMSGCINTIEKHYKLVECLQDRFVDNFVNINHGDFLTDYREFEQSLRDQYSGYDRIICNPPFKKIVAHIDQVYKCLKIGGVAVCLVPVTYKKIDHEVLDTLSNDTFLNCKVNTKIIRIIK